MGTALRFRMHATSEYPGYGRRFVRRCALLRPLTLIGGLRCQGHVALSGNLAPERSETINIIADRRCFAALILGRSQARRAAMKCSDSRARSIHSVEIDETYGPVGRDQNVYRVEVAVHISAFMNGRQ